MVDFSKVIAVRDRKLAKSRKKEKISIEICTISRETVAKALLAMNEYADDIKYLEVRLISKLMDRRVTVHDIHAIEAELKRAEQKALKLSHAHKEAKRVLLEKESQLTKIRAERIRNSRKSEKIKELDKRISLTASMNNLRAEEAKMDDFAEAMAARRLL